MNCDHKLSKVLIPLAVKLTLIMTGLITFSVGIVTSISIHRNHRIFHEELEQQAEVLLNTMAVSTADSLYFGDVELLDDIIDELSEQKAILSSRAYHKDGRIIADTENPEQHAFSLTKDPLGNKILQSQITLFDWQPDRLIAGKSIVLGDEAIGAISIELSTALLQKKNLDERNHSIVLALILGTIGAIISLWLSKSITEPITEITKATEHLTQGNLERPIEVSTNDEVAILAKAFNDMTAKLKKVIDNLQQSEQLASQRAIQLEKTLRELQLAKEKAETASNFKTQFLSNMSHELRTPLNSILGYVQILRRNFTLTPQQTRGLNIIYNSGNHLLNLINDILDLSKIEVGKFELVDTDINLKSFVEDIVDIMEMQAKVKSLEFYYKAQSSIPISIQADEKRLRQVLLNLLSNAIKFTDQGTVTLSISVVQIAAKDELLKENQTTLHFEVTDTGIGINSQQLAKIFQPFEQVGDVKRQETGTGLGLTITRHLVELMGGKLQVSSELDKGSIFWFEATFPVREQIIAQDNLTEPKKILGYEGERRHILIVDDKEDNCLILKNMLEPLGFEVTLGENGQQEIELARQIQPDCILTDLIMPVKTGFEAVQEIRQIPDLQNVIIIGISASDFNNHHQQSQIAGCEAFLTKPVDETNLLTLLQEFLHLDWIYEATDETDLQRLEPKKYSTDPSLIPLPPEEIEILYELAMLGNMKKIRERAIYLQKLDEQYFPFAAKLKDLAHEFQEKAIINLVEQYISQEKKNYEFSKF